MALVQFLTIRDSSKAEGYIAAWATTMVYYPSRQNFLRLMTNSPVKGIHHKESGLERAVLMPGNDWSPT